MQQRKRRSRLTLGFLALGLLTGAALTASPAQAASGPGPYYAEPAWDQKLPADTRFMVLTNWGDSEAVLDKETGLVWERSPATTLHTWNDARSECTGRTTGNRKGWRLPSVHELASLIHPNALPGPTLQPGHPFLTVQSVFYWSATTDAVSPTVAWGADFFNGNVRINSKTVLSLHVWCARGGMHAEAY